MEARSPSEAQGREKKLSPRRRTTSRGTRESPFSRGTESSPSLGLGRGFLPRMAKAISPPVMGTSSRGRVTSSLGRVTFALEMVISSQVREIFSLEKAISQLAMGSFSTQVRAISDQDLGIVGPCCWLHSAGRTSSASSGCRPSCRPGRGCATARTPRPPPPQRRLRALSQGSPHRHQTHPEEDKM